MKQDNPLVTRLLINHYAFTKDDVNIIQSWLFRQLDYGGKNPKPITVPNHEGDVSGVLEKLFHAFDDKATELRND